jgi:ubiquinone/menaquinone biosynthesis C-methylase UbiE
MSEIAVTFDAADQYEQIMGKWSRAIGEKFLDWLALPTGLAWLDIGCGTGAFTQVIARRLAPKTLAGADPAPAQIEHARRQVPQAEFHVAGADSLPFASGTFDVVASALVINFIPDRAKALSEMKRVLQPGGVVTAYLWDRDLHTDRSPHAPMEQGLREIGAEVLKPPTAPESTPEGARLALESAGFDNIVVGKIEATESFASFDDYWRIQNLPLAPIAKAIAKLTDEQRSELYNLMKARLAPGPDGHIGYSSRALAFKARKPAK